MKTQIRTPKTVYLTLAAGFAMGAGTLAIVLNTKPFPQAIAQVSGQTATPRLMSATSAESVAELKNLNESFANLAEYAAPAVVDIKAVTDRRQGPNGERIPMMGGEGSGFIYRADGYVITNDHVVGGFDKVTVTLRDGREYPGKVIRGGDISNDLAIIKIDAKDLPTLSFANSKEVRPGQIAMALGAPFGLENTVTVGHISALHRSERIIENKVYPDLIQTDTSINRGNSGGPLVNIDGQVIGVNTAIFSPSGTSAGIGFAIPSNQVKLIADILISKGKITRAFLGVQPETLKEYRRKELNVTGGAVAVMVTPDSPAGKAGLKEGDVITNIGGTPVSSSVDLRNTMLTNPAGSTVAVKYIRDGKPAEVKVKLAELPSQMREQNENSAPQGQNPRFNLPPGFLDPFDDNGPSIPNTPRRNAPSDNAQPRLGVEVAEPSAEMRTQFRIPAGQKGAIVVSTEPGSVGSTLGMRMGDLVTGFGDVKIESAKQLVDAVKKVKPGESRQVTFIRFTENGRSTVSATANF